MRSRFWSSAWLLLLVLVPAVAGCGDATPQPGPYDYDAAAPLAVRDAGVVNHDFPVKIHDVSYVGDGHRVPAYLLLPPARTGRHPAVVYLHGSGGTRLDLVTFAAKLSLRGAVTMSLDVPESDAYRPMVVDVRRALDLLDARSDVDPERIGIVGYSLGGQLAALVAGVDRRPAAVGIIAGRDTPEARQAIGSVRADLFFQAGVGDQVVPTEQLEALVDAAPERQRRVKWYPTGHGMSVAVFDEQNAWQARELELPNSPS
jgi:dienelactone hydrolase